MRNYDPEFCDKLRKRIAKSVRVTPSGCHEWKHRLHPSGYAYFQVYYAKKRVMEKGHRLAYTLAKGSIPEGLQIDHLCRNRACLNPDHLRAVTQRENVLAGISPAALHAAKTHCKHGHPFDEENTIRKGTRRYCRACRLRSNRSHVKNPGIGMHYNSFKTSCKRGHPFNEQNTRTDAKGKRYCRECGALRRKGAIT